MKLWNKRICAGLLVLCLIAGFLPMGAQAALVEDASPYIMQQMLLGDDLTFRLQGNVNYHFAPNAVATLAYGDRVDTYRLEDLIPVGNNQYAVIADLAAAQMTEDITLTIRVGEVVVLQETYSIRNYLTALLTGNFSDQTKQLSQELLNYGAWAQKYFKIRQNDLANSGYEIEPQYAIAEEMPEVEISGSVTGVKFYGTSVRFISKTAVRYYFTGDVSNCIFSVDGVKYTPVSKDGMYYIEVPGVNPQAMETPMQVEVTDGADTLSVRYVPLDYFVRSYQKTTDETNRGLLQAAYSYFKTAASYTPEENENLGQSGSEKEEPEVVPDNENLILGFESYAEITGAKIAVGNQLGRMEINTDSRYIKQGKASLKVSPQGDYSTLGVEPYFKLDLLDSTCKTDDFSKFKMIAFNVYNPQNETLHINVGLVLGSNPDSYLTTIKQTLTVKPNGWTTCIYDLSIMAACGFYDLANVRYMTFSFAEYKQSKEDIPNVLYIDNLMGVPYGANEEIAPIDFGFETGLDFETQGQEYLFTGQGKENDATVERVRYYSLGSVRAPADGGNYGLRLSHGSDYFPTFRIHFGKELPADTQITFMAYARITSGTSQYNQSIFEYTGGGEATEQFKCDEWKELKIILAEPAEYIDLFWNYERAGITSRTASGEVYIDNIRATTPEPSGEFTQGINFEQIGHAQNFTGQGNATTDAVIQRVTYNEIALAAPTDGGEYALQMSRDGTQTLSFRINFGREMVAGTVITFMAYGKISGNGFLTSDTWQFQYNSGSNVTNSIKGAKWTEVSVTLPETAEYIDLLWKYDRTGIGVSKKSGVLIMDNFKAVEPIVAEGDFLEGVGFEVPGNKLLFTGQGVDQDATIERVAYTKLGVSAPTNGGEYALKLSHANNCWPTFRVNFGTTLKAGTTITFDFYGNYEYAAAAGVNKYIKLELSETSKKLATSEDPNQVVWTLVGNWNTAAITLTADTDHVDFFYNVADGQHGSSLASWILLDNFKAVEAQEPTEPEEPAIDLAQGIDFENTDGEQLFVGQGNTGSDVTFERVSYANAGVTAPANGGSYALKLSHASHCWPSFRVNFGKTLKAGTTITFDFYGNYDYVAAAGVNKYLKLELSGSSKGYATSADPNQVVWTLVETWNTATVTLTADCDHVDFFYNVADGQHGEALASWVLLDNFKATEFTEPEITEPETTEPETTEPEEPDSVFLEGVGFETTGNELYFTGMVTVGRVAYADVGASAPANGGSYALKLSHANGCWPAFQIDFGKTLKAGTKITFNIYGNYDYVAPSGTNKYIKLELAASSKNFATSADSNQVVWTLVETWATATITLTADTDHIDFFYNVADGQHGEVASWVLLDNIKAVEPQ